MVQVFVIYYFTIPKFAVKTYMKYNNWGLIFLMKYTTWGLISEQEAVTFASALATPFTLENLLCYRGSTLTYQVASGVQYQAVISAACWSYPRAFLRTCHRSAPAQRLLVKTLNVSLGCYLVEERRYQSYHPDRLISTAAGL